jgi:hypothetical protein
MASRAAGRPAIAVTSLTLSVVLNSMSVRDPVFGYPKPAMASRAFVITAP